VCVWKENRPIEGRGGRGEDADWNDPDSGRGEADDRAREAEEKGDGGLDTRYEMGLDPSFVSMYDVGITTSCFQSGVKGRLRKVAVTAAERKVAGGSAGALSHTGGGGSSPELGSGGDPGDTMPEARPCRWSRLVTATPAPVR
jgi:hypothetical protein